MKHTFTTVWLWISMGLSACGIGPHQMNGVSGRERTEYLKSIKPYGAHWVKAGMTRESRLSEFMQCGGYENLREGFEIQPNQSTTDFFKGYNAHVTQVSACMRSKGYSYLEQCDARCLHP
jgi:hypothetical protein